MTRGQPTIPTSKQLVFFKLIYAISAFLSGFYIWRFNVDFQVSEYNIVLVPLFLILLVAPWILLKRNYNLAAITLLTSIVLIANFQFFLAGGLDAPGVLWIAFYPPTMAALLGKRGAMAAYVVVAISFFLFYVLKRFDIGPNLIAQYGDYRSEKTLNLFFFILFSCWTAHLYLISEERQIRTLNEQRDDIDNLLRVLIHDVANGLTGLTYNLVQAKEQSDQNAVSASLDRIDKAVQDINTLLTQIRHLKSVKDGKMQLPLSGACLSIILNEVYDSATALAAPKGIKIQMELPRESLGILTEETILNNVILMNVIGNAVKFSHLGDKVFIRLSKEEATQRAVIEVRDHGVGIPPELLTDIFKFNNATTRLGTQGEKGTGYGLPLVQEYVQLLNGSIDIDSNSDPQKGPTGTKVILKFPLAEVPPQKIKPRQA